VHISNAQHDPHAANLGPVSSAVLTPRRLVSALVGIGVAASLLTLFVQRAGTGELIAALASLSFAALVPALCCEVAVQLFKALKWTAILRTVGPARFSSALTAVVIGAASTHVVPLRLDEVLRAAVLSRREGIPTATVLGTVALDRLLDVLVVVVLLGAITLVVDLPTWMHTGAVILWVGFVAAVVAIAVLLRAEAKLQTRLLQSSIPGLARLASLVESLALGLRSLPRGRALLGVLLGIVGEWGATVLFYVWIIQLFSTDIASDVPIVMALGNAVAYSVPNVPGALGMYEAVQAGILEQLAGLDQAQALVLALTAHAILMVPVTAVGILLGIREWRLGGLRPSSGDHVSTHRQDIPTIEPGSHTQ